MQTTILPLSAKQFGQFTNLAAKAQSFLCSDNVTFIELLCICQSSNPLFVKAQTEKFKTKYYPNGYRENKNPLSRNQLVFTYNWKPRINPFFHPYKDIEKTAFLRAVRACRDYLKSGMSEEDTDKLAIKIRQAHELCF